MKLLQKLYAINKRTTVYISGRNESQCDIGPWFLCFWFILKYCIKTVNKINQFKMNGRTNNSQKAEGVGGWALMCYLECACHGFHQKENESVRMSRKSFSISPEASNFHLAQKIIFSTQLIQSTFKIVQACCIYILCELFIFYLFVCFFFLNSRSSTHSLYVVVQYDVHHKQCNEIDGIKHWVGSPFVPLSHVAFFFPFMLFCFNRALKERCYWADDPAASAHARTQHTNGNDVFVCTFGPAKC